MADLYLFMLNRLECGADTTLTRVVESVLLTWVFTVTQFYVDCTSEDAFTKQEESENFQ